MPSISRRRSTQSDTSSDSGYSDSSDRSRSTAPTEHSDQPDFKYTDTLYQHAHRAEGSVADSWDYPVDEEDFDDAASVVTYASTHLSEEDFEDDALVYQEPYYEPEITEPRTTPATPEDFAHCFPTSRRLFIRHDDSSFDGNMNLQVYTEIPREGDRVDLTLFHLRMHDLKNREFSLRRYCRESGREVCHSSRKYTKPACNRPATQRSMSSALSTLRGKSSSKAATLESLKRRDSGYASHSEEDLEVERFMQSPKSTSSSLPLPTNTTHLEFSNYAHVDVKRRGTGKSKRYGFEYWGTEYAWRRVASKTHGRSQVAYHLSDTRTAARVAHIVPDMMTTAESCHEVEKGGWVPPCSMYISDEKVVQERLLDIAEWVTLGPKDKPRY